MRVAMKEPICSACHGTHLVVGTRWFHEGFKPDAKFISYSIIPHACLDCGCITPFLDENDFQDLKEKLKK